MKQRHYAIYWRNPKTRAFEKIDGYQVCDGEEGRLLMRNWDGNGIPYRQGFRGMSCLCEDD